VADVVWWEIETPAPEHFQEFHGALWGWTFEPAFRDTALGADYWIIKEGDKSLGGLQRAATSAAPHAGARIFVEVADLEATLRQVTAIGGQIERERTALGGTDGWFAIVRDPSGTSFGLWTSNSDSRRT
jgi:predicted enzyme related to lactoylglutathione lyase